MIDWILYFGILTFIISTIRFIVIITKGGCPEIIEWGGLYE